MSKPALFTGVYRLDTTTIDKTLAHLYEHMLIMQFDEIVKQHGHSSYGWGWVGGETFDDVIFIEYGIYSSDIFDLLQEFMHSESKIDINSTDIALRQIEAEDRSVADVTDRQKLEDDLLRMNTLAWTDLEHDDSPAIINAETSTDKSDEQLLRLRPSAKSFRYITYTFELGSLTPDEAALASRLVPFMHDIGTEVLSGIGAYRYRWSLLKRHNATGTFVCGAIHCIHRGKHTKDIQAQLTEAVRAFTTTGHEKEFMIFFDSFLAVPNWHYFPIDFYREACILTSKRHIVSLSTPENIQSIFDKITVKVTPTAKHHWDIIN